MAHRYPPTRAYRPRRAPRTVTDQDACALYASVAKDAQPSHERIEAALGAIERMLHRGGSVTTRVTAAGCWSTSRASYGARRSAGAGTRAGWRSMRASRWSTPLFRAPATSRLRRQALASC